MINALYRGKRIDNGEWVYGNIVLTKDKAYILPDIADFTYGDNGNRIRIGCFVEVNTETVGQWTGREDKTGIKIFEGDYVGIWGIDENGNEELIAYGVVTWWESDARYMLTTEEGLANDRTYEDEALAENWRHLFVLGDKFGMKYPVG